MMKTILKEGHPLTLILACVSFLFFLWCCAPVAAGILNVGNIAGAGGALAATAAFLFWKPLGHWISGLWASTGGKVFLLVSGTVLALLAVLITTLTVFMVIRANRSLPQDLAQNPNLIVLGCSVKGDQPSQMLKARLDAAYDYLEANPDTVAIVTGGQGEDENISEAQCMYNYLTERGIAPERIYREDRSTDTRENFAFSMELIETYDLGDTFAVATHDFHQLRASVIAGNHGLTVYS
ncbi:MAG: YdcF family protein, partial [Clostridiales bacterium]|nr:YdcF family protein [Clostridiales bacterium]